MSLRTSDLEYDLPEGAIATAPAEPRDAAKLMVLWRSEPGRVEHATVRDLPRFVRAGDLLVVNQTRVLRARLLGTRVDTGGKVQGLYLGNALTHEGMKAHRLESLSHLDAHRRWVVMLQGKSMRPGIVVRMVGASGAAVDLRLLERDASEHAAWVVEVVAGDVGDAMGPEGDAAVLERVGWTPLPPYILKARTQRGEAGDEGYDRTRYQTVFAAGEGAHRAGEAATPTERDGPGDVGSVAAPTAGLHLTDRVMAELSAAGVRRAAVTLHVGSGTFKPVEAETLAEHRMHTEWCSMERGTREEIVRTRGADSRGRVICVGTTSARTVESFAMAAERGEVGSAGASWLATDILIEPGYRWRWTDGLLTNFHLPRTTLLAMVASMLERPGEQRGEGAGESLARLKGAYAEALSRGYRFFSYGDAMLILP
jgi:S-adenosylmethionine:tRNA ribosyltransferase-isomerase